MEIVSRNAGGGKHPWKKLPETVGRGKHPWKCPPQIESQFPNIHALIFHIHRNKPALRARKSPGFSAHSSKFPTDPASNYGQDSAGCINFASIFISLMVQTDYNLT
jgi:hypothetical protein